MQLQTEGIIVARSKFGESDLILTIFSKDKGILKGLLKGALKGKSSHLVQLGNIVDVNWYVRLESQLGKLKVELKYSIFAAIYHEENNLLALSSICNLVATLMPEGLKDDEVYEVTKNLIISLSAKDFFKYYIKWEILMLQHLGYGCDFSVCAVCNKVEPLAYVSPRTGRAVCEKEGKKYAAKLLRLPKFLVSSEAECKDTDKEEAIILTEHFISKLCRDYNKQLSYHRKILARKFVTCDIS